MTLVSCPDCGADISDTAPHCIKCGRPMAAQIIEQTAKQWKAAKTLGALVAVLGAAIVFVEPRSGFLLLVVGFATAGLAGFGAWWHHG